MSYSTTRPEMIRYGGQLIAAETCTECGAKVERWTTGKRVILLDVAKTADAHEPTRWHACRKPAPARPAGNRSRRQHDVQALRAASNARIVVAIYDDGAVSSWRDGIPAEELRHELITEANLIRKHMEEQRGR